MFVPSFGVECVRLVNQSHVLQFRLKLNSREINSENRNLIHFQDLNSTIECFKKLFEELNSIGQLRSRVIATFALIWNEL